MAKKNAAAPVAVSFPYEQADILANKMLSSFQIQNRMYLSYGTDSSQTRKKSYPSVSIHPDNNQYFDPNADAIHLGSRGPVDFFAVDNEEDYISGMEFLFGHENQHVRSTATIPYNKGVLRCAQVMIEYMAKKEGIAKRFRNERDYEVFLTTDLRNKGIYVSFRTLHNIAAALMNSIEDGRIERIRALEFPGFAKQRTYFRGLEWANDDAEYTPYAELKPEAHLSLMMGVIHSLATKNIYPKGFAMAYAGTPIIDEVTAVMPHVAKAVLAGKTRRMADNVVKVTECMAPCIYEAVKANAEDVENAMAQMLAQLLSKMFSQMDPSKMAQLSERDEGEASEQECSVFGMSDLVIEVDNETFDKMMENAKKSGEKGPGLMIKRKDPKESEDKDGEKSGQGSGSDKKDEDKKDSKGAGKSGEQNKSDEQSKSGQQQNQDGEKGEASNGSQSGQSQNSQNSENSSGQSESNDAYSDSKDKTVSNEKQKRGDAEGSGSQSSGISDGNFQDVLDAMEKAAAECRQEAEETVSTINRATVTAGKTTAPIVQDVDKPISAKDVKDICSRFEEVKRKYKLDQQLPTVLNARAKAFRKKNEKYFKSLSTPNVTNLSSGGVDPSLIYGLTFGETNIFRKIGQDKKFNGCVYILIDNSGSMDGNKRKEACKAAAVIEEGFKGIIPMKIVAFDYSGTVIHEVVKGWNESQKLNCCWNFACHGRNGCGNTDNVDILIAQRELLSRPEEKKLLIVLSDGAPADTKATQQAIADTRKKGITVFGIYFEEGRVGNDASTFQQMYQKDYVCCALNEVDEQLTKLLMKFSRS